MIIHEMIDKAFTLCRDKTVKTAVCGSAFTAVELSDGSVGVSYRYNTLEAVSIAGSIAGRPAGDLVRLALEGNLEEASLGLAAINALTASGRHALPSTSMWEMLSPRADDVVGVVGGFGEEFLRPFRAACAKTMVFELAEGPDFYPFWSEPLYLPQCDIVIITGATLVNKTIDAVLASSTKAREIVVMGPTAVYMPDLLKAHGVTILSGAEVVDPKGVLKVIQEGGFGQDVLPFTRAFNLRI